jgi:ubiquinone/menaquinone biosynthesis C-methylase UbiE
MSKEMKSTDGKNTALRQLVIEEFASPAVVKHFTENIAKGLWESEKILVHKYFAKGSSVLDLGCGAGRTTVALHLRGHDIVGIDLVPAMVSAAMKYANSHGFSIKYAIGDATHLSFRSGSFDNVVFSNQGWTQIPGMQRRILALREINRVLKPGGGMLISTHIRPPGWRNPVVVFRWVLANIKSYVRADKIHLAVGDYLFVRKIPGHSGLPQYVHIPTMFSVERLIKQLRFRLMETLKEQGEAHVPVLYFATKQYDETETKL